MKRIAVIIILIGLQISLFGQNKDKTYLLVHGAWHGAWCWNKVVPIMKHKGYKVETIDLPSHGNDTTNANSIKLDDYVKKVIESANKIEGQIILVGHSMGGIVISQAAEILGKNKVFKLIYLDAFLPKNGESVSSLARLIESYLPKDTSRLTIGSGLIVSEDKMTSIFKPEVADMLFYHDCSQADKDFAHRNMSRQSFAPLGTPVSVSDSIYGKIPKYFILCTDSKDLDKSILPSRVKCEKLVKLNSSHSPFFSKPRKLTNILIKL